MSVEGDKTSLSAHVDSLKGELLNKSMELEEKEHKYNQLQSKFAEAGQKHTKDLENVAVQVAQLEKQVIFLLLFCLFVHYRLVWAQILVLVTTNILKPD